MGHVRANRDVTLNDQIWKTRRTIILVATLREVKRYDTVINGFFARDEKSTK